MAVRHVCDTFFQKKIETIYMDEMYMQIQGYYDGSPTLTHTRTL